MLLTMRKIFYIALGLSILSCSKKEESQSLKSILIQQLKNSHSNEDWYAPINVAVAGISSEQANWKDSSENHSIAELVSHLIFWNSRVLKAFQGNTPPDFKEDNKVTFKALSEKDWDLSVKKLDSLQTTWEQLVEMATDLQLKDWSSSIANIGSHNAYHTGQIVYIRKRNGWWRIK